MGELERSGQGHVELQEGDGPDPRKSTSPALASRAAILEAAAVAFNRDGFPDSTLELIAKQANTSVSNVRAHFEDTHEVLDGLKAMIRSEADEMFLLTLPDGLSVVGKLELLVRHQAAWGNHRREALSFFGRQPRGRRELELDAWYLEGTIGWFKRHRVASELDLRVSEEDAAYVFRAIQIGFYQRWVARGGAESFSDTTATILDVFLNGVRAAS